MSTPQPSSHLNLHSRSPTPALFDGQGTPASFATLPADRFESTATTQAWRNAIETYRRSLPDKDFNRIMIPARPEDVLNEIEKWQSRQKKSKYCKVADGVQAGISRLRRFDRALDLIAQGTPSPGCLLWGSIVFVLTIVQNAAEEYNKLCMALIRMTECLPRIELYTDTFLDSSLVQDCVTAFYSSILRFWTRACKFYRRRRLWNSVRAVWKDYDAEFSVLEIDMVRCRNRVEESAMAEHIQESKAARIQQHTMITSISQVQSSSNQKDIIAWLAPTGYPVDYYIDDFTNAKAVRHSNTCQWLLSTDGFIRFSHVTRSSGSLLWIYAQPGAGKTVLTAFLIEHLALHQRLGFVLFFFCKDTDDDKRTAIAIARSLLYQLFHVLRERALVSALTQEISLAMEESGHAKALRFATVWKIFSNHISDLGPAMIIVDALDECRDSETLVSSLRSMANSHNVRIILTSRREEHLYQLLHECPYLEIGPDDVDSDIKAYVKAKVASSPRLSQPAVKDLVVKRLCDSHEGMFLWVQYMLKELKSCLSLQQVQEELREMPKGMYALYQRILHRLQETLDKQTFKLCSKVLSWVTTSLRPLRIDELKQALESQYLHEGHSLLSTDGSFPYSDKDIELVCGSLVVIRNETLQIVHLTVKQYIKSPSGPTTLHLLTETKGAGLQLTLACLSFLKHKCVEPIAKLLPERPIDVEDDALDLSRLYSKDPFLEYACFSWMVHLIDCVNMEALEASRSFYHTFSSPSTFGWIESCMTLQSESVARLLISLEDVRDWVDNLQSDAAFAEDTIFSFVSRWCITMEQVLKEYNPVIKQRPAEIYYLDLAPIFTLHGLTDMYEEHGGLMRRDKCQRFHSDKIPRPVRKEVPPERQLKSSFASKLPQGVLLYESIRDIYIWIFAYPRHGQELLFAQSASSGRRLPPLNGPENALDDDELCVPYMLSYAMSEDGKYLGTVYRDYHDSIRLWIVIWEIESTLNFTRRMQALPWARVFHSSTIEEQSSAHLWSNPCITFDHAVCYTPNGLVPTASGAESLFQDNPLQRLSDKITHEFSEIREVFYSGDGHFLFVSSKTTITKYTFPDLEVHFKMSLSGNTKLVPCRSPRGRYLAFVADYQRQTVSGPTENLNNISLVDTLSGKTIFLPHLVGRKLDTEHYEFYFSIDEKEVFACLYSTDTSVYHYIGLPNEIFLRARGRCPFERIKDSTESINFQNHRAAHFVTESGEIQRISLDHEIKFLNAPDMSYEYPSQAIFLSHDGSRWAGIYYGSEKVQIQIHTVLKPTEHPRCIELQRTSSLSDALNTPITMSMDLSVVVLDWEVHSLGNSKLGDRELTVRTLKLPRHPEFSPSAFEDRSTYCSIDSSNEFIVCYTKESKIEPIAHPSDLFALFRINFDESSTCRLQPSLPENMIDITAIFHPSIPLLMIGYGLTSEARGSHIPGHVILIDINTMSQRAVGVEQNLSTFDIYGVAFSSCGEFIYGMPSFQKFEYVVKDLRKLDIIEANAEAPPRSYRYVDDFFAIDSDVYTLSPSTDRNSLVLGLTKVQLRRTTKIRESVWLPNLVYLSSSYAKEPYVYLILGNTDEDYMHALVIPRDRGAPELKRTPLSWAEARAILQKKWEDVNPDASSGESVEEDSDGS